MTIRFQKTMLSSKKLSTEVLIAFGLIVLTLLVLVGYIYPGVTTSLFSVRNSLPYVIGIGILIVVFGFFIIIQIVEPIIKISQEAKMIVGGDLSRQIKISRKDEVGDLGNSFNFLTGRIRESLDELQTLSQKTESLNHEIESRISILSNLMEISNQIAQKAPLNDILDTIVKKSLASHRMSFGCIILRDRVTNQFKIQYLSEKKKEILLSKDIKNTKIQLGQGLLGKALLRQNAVLIDSRTQTNQEVEEFKGRFLIRNAIVTPISSKGTAYGLLIAGNDEPNFVCTETEKELTEIIAKHIAIAALSEGMSKEIERFEVTDNLTGLYNNSFARNRLNLEIQQAKNSQKPCSFILVQVDNFKEYSEAAGHIKAENALIKIGRILKELIDEEDKAARFAEFEFAVILAGTNKKEAISLANNITKRVEIEFGEEKDVKSHLTVTAAVVENPLDGASAEELILKSGVILADAREQGGNRVSYQV
jgi:diguanylate cyclase (GGDEF)-like protein